MSEQPEEAFECLDSINYFGLGEPDRHYYDLLSVKACDKAYIEHTSDSLILSVVDYYASHSTDNLYPEALYYAGRVYSDLGDSPTALHYFHKALEHLDEENKDPDLRASILSQTGRLLNHLRFYKEAVPYIEESIRIAEIQKDTMNWVYDLQLLGNTYLRAEEYGRAGYYFNRAIDLSHNLPVSFEARSRMYLAEVKYETGKLDSALILIRHTPDEVSRIARNLAMGYASRIYLDNGITDTAYIYASELIRSPDSHNKGIGYETLMSPALGSYVPTDSLYRYIPDFIMQLETEYNDNEVNLSAIQQGYYNYSRHQTERQKAENRNMELRMWLLVVLSVCLLLIAAVLFYKNRGKKTLIDLHNALITIDTLKERINMVNETMADKGSDHKAMAHLTSNNVEILRKRLSEEVQELIDRDESMGVSTVIMESEAYKKLMDIIMQKKGISIDDPLWIELETAVTASSPMFKVNLMALTNRRLTTVDLHTALLIKCHVTPTEMTTLLSRSKGAIVSRRDNLCRKIFGRRLGTTFIDGIIRQL